MQTPKMEPLAKNRFNVKDLLTIFTKAWSQTLDQALILSNFINFVFL